MADPSDYELAAWRDIQRFRDRPLSRAMRNAGEQVANGAAALGKRATKYLENHPRAQSTVSRGQEIVTRGTDKVGAGARGAANVLPDWGGTAFQSVRQTVGRSRESVSHQNG